jgi:hypothetical protein
MGLKRQNKHDYYNRYPFSAPLRYIVLKHTQDCHNVIVGYRRGLGTGIAAMSTRSSVLSKRQ